MAGTMVIFVPEFGRETVTKVVKRFLSKRIQVLAEQVAANGYVYGLEMWE